MELSTELLPPPAYENTGYETQADDSGQQDATSLVGSQPEERYLSWDILIPTSAENRIYIDPFPMSGPFVSCLSERHKVILKMAVVDGLIASYNNSTYMLVPQSGCWLPIRSDQALRQIADTVGLEGVTVNFPIACDPYVCMAERIATEVAPIPMSYCIGTLRLRIFPSDSVEGRYGYNIRICGHIAPVSPEAHNKFPTSSSFCVSPVSSKVYTSSWSGAAISTAETTLLNVFSPQQMEIIKWVIGNGLVDPVAKPRVLYLYGSGGEGKTTTINTLVSNLRGTVHTMSQDFIGGTRPIPPAEIKACMVSRFVTYGDVVLENSKINKSNWKVLTGNDSVKVDSGSGQLSCTTLLASNNLWYGSRSLQKSWFVRRTIPLVMKVPARGCPPPTTSFGNADITCFVNNCVLARVRYGEDPPIGVDTMLICMFGYRVGVATRGIELDAEASDFECLIATWSISIAGGLPYDDLVALASASSGRLVREYSGTKVIIGIRPRYCEYKGDEIYELVED